jgi:DNA-binding GntR family transcriptional regulator
VGAHPLCPAILRQITKKQPFCGSRILNQFGTAGQFEQTEVIPIFHPCGVATEPLDESLFPSKAAQKGLISYIVHDTRLPYNIQRLILQSSMEDHVDVEMPIESNTKAEIAYQRIRASILSGELAPNTKIVITHVANKFGVSNIPVREALKRLEAEGLVTITPHTDAHVAPFDAQLLRELYPIRILLEGYAVRLSAERRTPADTERFRGHIATMERAILDGDMAQMGRLNYDFHVDVYQVGGNQSLVRYIKDLWQNTGMAHMVFPLVPSRAATSNHEHKAIVDAIEKGDGALAETLLIKQNQRTMKILLKYLEKQETDNRTEKRDRSETP